MALKLCFSGYRVVVICAVFGKLKVVVIFFVNQSPLRFCFHFMPLSFSFCFFLVKMWELSCGQITIQFLCYFLIGNYDIILIEYAPNLLTI